MNIDDVNLEEDPTGTADMLTSMFNKQRELMDKYDEIESRNGFNVPPHGTHIDDKYVQARIKDLFWRVTEEIAEAFEHEGSLDLRDWRSNWENDSVLRHFFEELADSLHFLIEATIIAGVTPSEVILANPMWAGGAYTTSTPMTKIQDTSRIFINLLGLAANCLKNKPWKNTHMPTDSIKFKGLICDAWVKFGYLWQFCDAGLNDVYKLYMKKNTVNKFRQATNY